MSVVIETTLGDITVDLFLEERPRACLNFLKLCKLKYYNFNLFHTIERDFIAQTGDPTGAGDGGESVWGVVEGPHKRFFEAESLPKIKHTEPGLLSLVSVGKFMVGSQFFFTLGADLTSLDGMHCVIGEVVEGREILRKLNEAIVDEKFRPYQDIRVTHTVILDDPFNDPRGFQVPNRSPSPSAERMQNGRIGADEDIDDTAGKTAEEVQEMLAEREAKARATILEIVGDLPDADIAPPENVLFVCKLNPVTTDDDLEIIFSRFGKVIGCEVIRDKVSGDSLQYAFVEFEDRKACEAAYFKMDNVLIDDRRIHVDFSQSVSKVQWRGKGRGLIHKDGKDRKLDFNDLKGDRRNYRQRSRSPRRAREYQPRERRRGYSPQSSRRRPPESRERRNSRLRSNSRGRTSSKTNNGSDSRLASTGDNRRERSRSPQRRHSPPQKRRSTSRDLNYPQRRSSNDQERRRPQQRNYSRGDYDRRRNIDHSSRSREQRERFPNKNGHNQDESRMRHDKQNAEHEKPSKSSKVESSSGKSSKKKTKKSVEKKKKRKASTSSSETDTESDSSSSSSSPSERKKSKKSKKSKSKLTKSKKQVKKKSKRRQSSSSD